MSSKIKFEAMFDVRPASSDSFGNGQRSLPEVVDLKKKEEEKVEPAPIKNKEALEKEPEPIPVPPPTPPLPRDEESSGGVDEVSSEEAAQILSSIGSIHQPKTKFAFRRPDIKKTRMSFEAPKEPDVEPVDYELPAPKEVEPQVQEVKEEVIPQEDNKIDVWLDKVKDSTISLAREDRIPWYKKYKKHILWGGIIVALIFGFTAFSAKNSGEKAINNLETARANLEDFDFENAAINFTLAKESLHSAGRNLNLLGLNLTALFKGIPGLNKVSSAKDLINAGEELAKAGEELSVSLDRLSKTNFVSYFGFNGEEKESLSIFVDSFKKPILQAQIHIQNANDALSGVKNDIIPEDKKELFADLKSKLPLFEGFVKDAVEYSNFLSSVIGEGGSRKYLVLFQNTSELRATGGFPGSYALVTLDKGYFQDVFVDDVYNPDGQIKEKIIPPQQLQHITPNWGMRDANWFADFPTSAAKIIEFYKKGSGGVDVDGVFSMTPDIITSILEVTGGIYLPEYDVTLDADNFVDTVQKEVEYGEREEGVHSKVILTDFTPLFLEKLSDLSQDKWVEVSNILLDGLSKKQILAYFADPRLQKVAVKNEFAGEVKNLAGDYLSVIHSNVKGSKADAYTDTFMKLDTVIESGKPKHTLTITRKHNGGNTELGFYNRQNPDYVRVLVPKGSELISIKGADNVDYRPLISYNNSGFVKDPDLERYEDTIERSRNNIYFLEESGKDVFAFWLVTDPGKEKTVTLEYTTPVRVDGDYKIYIQKQSGTIGQKLEYSFVVPSNLNLIYKSPYLGVEGNKVILNSTLDEDREAEIRFK